MLRNETLKDSDKKRVGYFSFHNNKWLFVNEGLGTLKDKTEDKNIPIGSSIELTNGKQILFSTEDGGRVAVISIANN